MVEPVEKPANITKQKMKKLFNAKIDHSSPKKVADALITI